MLTDSEFEAITGVKVSEIPPDMVDFSLFTVAVPITTKCSLDCERDLWTIKRRHYPRPPIKIGVYPPEEEAQRQANLKRYIENGGPNWKETD